MRPLTRRAARRRNHARIRRKIVGTPERPRLAVFRSLRHIYAQVIDDAAGRTVAAAGSAEKELRELEGGGNASGATRVGSLLAERARAAGVEAVVFDRGGAKYHGRVRALAEAVREGGIRC